VSVGWQLVAVLALGGCGRPQSALEAATERPFFMVPLAAKEANEDGVSLSCELVMLEEGRLVGMLHLRTNDVAVAVRQPEKAMPTVLLRGSLDNVRGRALLSGHLREGVTAELQVLAAHSSRYIGASLSLHSPDSPKTWGNVPFEQPLPLSCAQEYYVEAENGAWEARVVESLAVTLGSTSRARLQAEANGGS